MIRSTGLPRTARELVRNARLHALLDERPPLTVVRAPSGYGKTSLVAGWLRQSTRDGETVVWLSARATDTDADAFWRHVVRALSEAGTVVRASRAVPPLEQVNRALARTDGTVLLVVDDYDVVADEVDDDLLDLLRSRETVQVVVCLRNGQRLDPAGWHDIDGLVLTTTDLMLSDDQITDLFARLGVPEAPRLAVELAPQLGGWASAVRAVALGLRDSDGDPDGVDAAVARVRDRLATVVLRHFDPSQIEEVVLPSALLGTFTLDELARLTPSISADAADRILRSGFVLIDDTGPTTRYQWPRFGQDAILGELARRWPDRERALRKQIAASLQDGDRVAEAFAHAVQAEDWDLAASMLDRDWGSIFTTDRGALSAAVRQAPDATVRRRTSLLALQELFNPEATANAALARATLPGDADALRMLASGDHIATVLSTAQLVLVSLRGVGMFVEACHQADRILHILRRLPVGVQTSVASRLGGLALQCGLTYLHAGRLNDAIAALEIAFERGVDAPVPYVSRNAAGALAVTHGLLGAHVHAADWMQRAERAPDPDVWAKPFIDTTVAVARVLIAVARLDRGAALAGAEQLSSPPPRQMLLPIFQHARARVALHWGDRFGFAQLLREQREKPAMRTVPRSAFTQRLLLADEVDLTMALGAGSQADVLLESADSSAHVEIRRGWLALRSGRAREAASHAASALGATYGNAEDDIFALLLSAGATRALGEPESARRWSRLAVHRIAASTCRAPLEFLTPAERAALREDAAELPEASVLNDIGADTGIYSDTIAVIQLSERERAVLQHLAAGRSFSDIAEADFVTINTLKAQTRSLYRKLGAADRGSAVSVAYAVGLL